MTARLQWIDVLRGLAMVFVIYGHSIRDSYEFFVFTSPIKITLFFAITGYVFNAYSDSIKHFYTNMFKKVIVPWLVLSILPFGLMAIFKGYSYFFDRLVKILSGEIFWYIPCYIVALSIWFVIVNRIDETVYLVITSTACLFLGLLFYNNDWLNTFMLNRALVVQPFILFGYTFRKYEQKLVALNELPVMLCYVMLCYVSLYVYPGQSLDVHMNYYYSLPFCFFLIMVGLLSVFLIGVKKQLGFQPLVFIGKNTLVFYLMETHIRFVFRKIFVFLSYKYNVFECLSQIIGWIEVALILCVCAVASKLINKYAPGLVGIRH